MTFLQAVKLMEDGIEVRRDIWKEFLKCKSIDGEIVFNSLGIQGLTIADIKARDWIRFIK